MPAAPLIGRIRWLRPSHVVTCPSFSRNAAAGRNASANGSSDPSSSDWTTTRSTFWSALVASAASGKSRSGSTPIRNNTSMSRSAHASKTPHQFRPSSPTMIGPQRSRPRPLVGDPEPPASGQERRMHARHERSAIVRAARDVGEPRAGRARQLRDTQRWVPAVGQPRTGDHHAIGSRRAERFDDVRPLPERRRPAPHRGGTGCVPPHPTAGCAADAARRSSRRAARPCAAAGAGSGPPARRPTPATRMTFARSMSSYVTDSSRVARDATSSSASPAPSSRR